MVLDTTQDKRAPWARERLLDACDTGLEPYLAAYLRRGAARNACDDEEDERGVPRDDWA